ncbi:Formyl transferase [Hibiscus syriacus]|uniref:Formyl transferase n=1 Tax=Hibiscus syriacus TaxID=106335 RepID=A0A6A2XL71_HIBSY|nr:Formyl transferase [Hibiscus syriacus]
MEGVGARFGRSSTRYGPATVLTGPVRKWKKKWVHVFPSNTGSSNNNNPSQNNNNNHHSTNGISNGNNGSHLVLFKWTPLSQSQNNNSSPNDSSKDDDVASPEEPPRRKFKDILVFSSLGVHQSGFWFDNAPCFFKGTMSWLAVKCFNIVVLEEQNMEAAETLMMKLNRVRMTLVLQSQLPGMMASWLWRAIVENYTKEDRFGMCYQSHIKWRPLARQYPFEVSISQNFLSLSKDGKIEEYGNVNSACWVWNIRMRRNLADWELNQWMLLSNEGDWHCGLSYVWKGPVPPRVETLLWQVALQKVAVKLKMIKRGVIAVENVLCPLCKSCLETVSRLPVLSCVISWAKFPISRLSLDPLICDPLLVNSSPLWRQPAAPSVSWSHPPPGYYKVNVDGAVNLDWEKGGIGRLVRDSCGQTLGSSIPVSPVPSVFAELKAVKEGIIIGTSSSGCRFGQLILDYDCSNVVMWIKDPSGCPAPYVSLAKEIGSIIRRDDITIKVISRCPIGKPMT